MAVAGKIGAVYKADGVSTTFTDETTTADAAKLRYRITNAAKRYWDDSAAVTVKKNGVTQSNGFTLEMAGGVVVFTAALTSEVILVSGKYFTVAQMATFFDWKLDIERDTKDVTTFASNGWKESLSTLIGWSASAEGYWADGSFLAMVGNRIILVLYVDYVGADRYEGYIILKKNSIEEPVDDIVKETVEFEGTGALYYHDI